jgi:hypothetical protein
VVIDWESAHRLNATHETLLVALEWSGITSAFEHALFDQFLAAYRAAGGVIEHEFLQPAFDRIAGNWLDWLLFNVGRSINLADLEQRSLGAQQVELALATLLRLQRLLPGVLKGIRKQLWEAGPARRCSI